MQAGPGKRSFVMQIDWLTQLQWLGLIALAGLLGGGVGLERELAGKPAGLRTHIFICMTAAMFMLLGRAVVWQFEQTTSPEAAIADPTRILHAVVLGISFLGAGTILRAEAGKRVAGLTTAASIWLVTALGIAVALHQFVLAVGATVLALIVLVGLRVVDRWAGRSSERSE